MSYRIRKTDIDPSPERRSRIKSTLFVYKLIRNDSYVQWIVCARKRQVRKLSSKAVRMMFTPQDMRQGSVLKRVRWIQATGSVRERSGKLVKWHRYTPTGFNTHSLYACLWWTGQWHGRRTSREMFTGSLPHTLLNASELLGPVNNAQENTTTAQWPTCVHNSNGRHQLEQQVAQLSQRDRATHELLRLAKLRSGIFEPPFGGLRGKVGALSIPRWKAPYRLAISDKWTFS